MIKILGITLLKNKATYIALTGIYGIGVSTSRNILKSLNINPIVKIKDLTSADIDNIKKYINYLLNEKNFLKIEDDLKQQTLINIKRLIFIKSYRGFRHLKNLPVRGQRTRTNSRTSRKNLLKFNI